MARAATAAKAPATEKAPVAKKAPARKAASSTPVVAAEGRAVGKVSKPSHYDDDDYREASGRVADWMGRNCA